MSEFKYIKDFTIDDLHFQLYKNDEGVFKTILNMLHSDPQEQYYRDLDQLLDSFEDDLTRDDLGF